MLFSLAATALPLANTTTPSDNTLSNKLSSKSTKKLLKIGREKAGLGQNEEAKPYFIELLKRDSLNVQYNLEAGMVYYYSPTERDRCLKYFEAAQRNIKDNVILDLYYYLGKAYHLNARFDDAIAAYEKYKTLSKQYTTEVEDRDEEEDIKNPTADIDLAIIQCNNGKKIMAQSAKPIELKGRKYTLNIANPGKGLNTMYGDYNPLPTHNDSMMIFTSRRKGGTGKKVDEIDGKYFEDIYVSYKTPSGWTEPQGLSKNVNSKGHDAANNLSHNGKKLFFYRDDENGNIFSTELVDGKWTKPVRLTGVINSISSETSTGVGISDDVLYVVSDRKGGFGGKDIFKAVAGKDGNFTIKNLGETINTPYDEDAPFLTPGEDTLYFSSKGHTSIGGYDIFRSVKVNGEWTAPVNLGYPVNTTADDIYYGYEKGESHAYFSSNRIVNNLGDLDIFEVSYECMNVPLVEIKGNILALNSDKPVKAKITYSDKQTDLNKAEYVIETLDGSFSIALPPDKSYAVNVAIDGYKDQTLDITLPKQCDSYGYYQEVVIDWIKEGDKKTGERIVVKNAFFDVDKEAMASTMDEKTKLKTYSDYIKNIDKQKNNLAYNEASSEIKYTDEEILAINDGRKKPKKDYNIDGPTLPGITNPGTGAEDDLRPTDEKFINLLFEFNSTSLTDASQKELVRLYKYLDKYKSIMVVLAGHADSKGHKLYNMRLSKKRTDTAVKYLVDRGITRNRISTRIYGSLKPVAPNENPDGSDNPEGRKLNRRVEITIKLQQ